MCHTALLVLLALRRCKREEWDPSLKGVRGGRNGRSEAANVFTRPWAADLPSGKSGGGKRAAKRRGESSRS